MTRKVRPEFEAHYARRRLSVAERRQAIRQGYQDYQWFGWQKDPPYPMTDVRRWLWQNGAETAELARKSPSMTIEKTEGWRA